MENITALYDDYLYHNRNIAKKNLHKELHTILGDKSLSNRGKVELLHKLDFYAWQATPEELSEVEKSLNKPIV